MAHLAVNDRTTRHAFMTYSKRRKHHITLEMFRIPEFRH